MGLCGTDGQEEPGCPYCGHVGWMERRADTQTNVSTIHTRTHHLRGTYAMCNRTQAGSQHCAHRGVQSCCTACGSDSVWEVLSHKLQMMYCCASLSVMSPCMFTDVLLWPVKQLQMKFNSELSVVQYISGESSDVTAHQNSTSCYLTLIV